MLRGFCPRGFCPEGAYVLMELCMEGVLSKGVLSGGDFVLPSHQHNGCSLNLVSNYERLMLVLCWQPPTVGLNAGTTTHNPTGVYFKRSVI